jgi:hypothetical protein
MAAVGEEKFDGGIDDRPAQDVSKVGNGVGRQIELESGHNETEIASIEKVERVYKCVLSRTS